MTVYAATLFEFDATIPTSAFDTIDLQLGEGCSVNYIAGGMYAVPPEAVVVADLLALPGESSRLILTGLEASPPLEQYMVAGLKVQAGAWVEESQELPFSKMVERNTNRGGGD